MDQEIVSQSELIDNDLFLRRIPEGNSSEEIIKIADQMTDEDAERFVSLLLTSPREMSSKLRALGWEHIRRGKYSPNDFPRICKQIEVFYQPDSYIGRKGLVFCKKGIAAAIESDEFLTEEIRLQACEILFNSLEFYERNNDQEYEGIDYTLKLLHHLIPANSEVFNEYRQRLNVQIENRDKFLESNLSELTDALGFLTPDNKEIFELTANKAFDLVYNQLDNEESAMKFYNYFYFIYGTPRTNELLSRALLHPEVARAYIKDTTTQEVDWRNEPWSDSMLESAWRTVRESDERNATAEPPQRFSSYFDRIPYEALVDDPNYFTCEGTVDDKNLWFASNGFIAFTRPAYNFEMNRNREIVAKRLDLDIDNLDINRDVSMVVHFTPYDQTEYDNNMMLEVLKMGINGLRNFIKLCDAEEIPDNTMIFGETNPRMAHIACRLGFVHALPEGKDPKDLPIGSSVKLFGKLEILRHRSTDPKFDKFLERMNR